MDMYYNKKPHSLIDVRIIIGTDYNNLKNKLNKIITWDTSKFNRNNTPLRITNLILI